MCSEFQLQYDGFVCSDFLFENDGFVCSEFQFQHDGFVCAVNFGFNTMMDWCALNFSFNTMDALRAVTNVSMHDA